MYRAGSVISSRFTGLCSMSRKADEYLDFLMSRRSSKKLEYSSVPLSDVVRALEATVRASNAHNAQPWRFVVVTEESVKRRLLEEMEKEWRRDLTADGLDDEKVRTIVNYASERTRRASVIVVACLAMVDMDQYPDQRRRMCEYIMGVQSVAAGLQNMLLAFHALGYGACWRCSPLFAPKAVRLVLGIPEEVEPQALIEVGGVGGVRPAERRPLREVAYINRWGEPL